MDAVLTESVASLVPMCIRELREDHQEQLRHWVCSVVAADVTGELQHITDRPAAARQAFDALLAETDDNDNTTEDSD